MNAETTELSPASIACLARAACTHREIAKQRPSLRRLHQSRARCLEAMLRAEADRLIAAAADRANAEDFDRDDFDSRR